MGSLTQTVTVTSPGNANLTTIGAVDWAVWPNAASLVASDWKSGAGHTIPNPTLIGSSSGVNGYSGDARTLNWTDGTNVGTGSSTNGIYNAGITGGDGFQLVLPADTSTRTVYIYTGGYSLLVAATVTATLSDGSAGPVTDSTTLTGATLTSIDGLIKLVYSANSPGQTLTLQWYINTSTNSNVTLNGVAVQSVSSGGASGSAAITEASDVVSAAGAASTAGSAAITEGHDTANGSGVAGAAGVAAITEGVDTVAASGVSGTAGSASVTEGHDTVAGIGSASVAGSAAIQEASDTAVGVGTTVTAGAGAAAITEGADAVAGVGVTVPPPAAKPGSAGGTGTIYSIYGVGNAYTAYGYGNVLTAYSTGAIYSQYGN